MSVGVSLGAGDSFAEQCRHKELLVIQAHGVLWRANLSKAAGNWFFFSQLSLGTEAHVCISGASRCPLKKASAYRFPALQSERPGGRGSLWFLCFFRVFLPAASCATAASACLSPDSRVLAVCDGSCVLTLDVAAAVNSEAAAPYNEALAAPLGVLHVGVCPQTSEPKQTGVADCTACRAEDVLPFVRAVTLPVHSEPAHRR